MKRIECIFKNFRNQIVNAVHNRKAATPRQARLTKSTVKTDVDLQARAARH